MAKANWISTNKVSGTGNSTIDVTTTKNLGRSSRNSTVTIKTINGNPVTKEVPITQSGAAVNFTNIEKTPINTVPFTGSNCSITGTSNSKTIGISETVGATKDWVLTVNGVTQTLKKPNNYTWEWTITGDPGSTGTFNFTITGAIKENISPTRLIAVNLLGTDGETVSTGTPPAKSVINFQQEAGVFLNSVTTDPNPPTFTSSGGSLVIEADTNGRLFTAQESTNSISFTSFTNNGTAISNTGTEGEYQFKLPQVGSNLNHVKLIMSVPSNKTATAKTYTFVITAFMNEDMSGDHFKRETYTVTVGAFNSTLTVSPTTLTFTDGIETKTITVTSNDDWVVS